MAKTEKNLETMDAHRLEMIALALKIDAELGITGEPVGHDALMEMQRKLGIRPEDNGASRELLRMRYGDDYDPDNDPFLKENEP